MTYVWPGDNRPAVMRGFNASLLVHCKGGVSPVFARNLAKASLKNNEFWLIASSPSQTRAGKPVVRGATKVIRRPDSLYIDLICSKAKAGTAMKEELRRMARGLRLPITLSSVPEARGAYERWGFKYERTKTGKQRTQYGLYKMRRSRSGSKSQTKSRSMTRKSNKSPNVTVPKAAMTLKKLSRNRK